MKKNPFIDSPEKFHETLEIFTEKLGDVVCQAENGLQMMAPAYAAKLLPFKIQIAAVQSILINNLQIDEGVTYMIVFHCFNQLQEIESQGAIKKIISKNKNDEKIKKINALWQVIQTHWHLLEGTGKYKKFTDDMLDFISK